MNRINGLLLAIANEFENLNYIDGDFVVENDISASELKVFELAGSILKGYLALPVEEQFKIVLMGEGIDADVLESAANQLKLKQLVKELTKS